MGGGGFGGGFDSNNSDGRPMGFGFNAIMPTHKGMENFMPKVKYDRKKVMRLLEQIVENASTSDEDRHKVALDLFFVALDAQDTEYRVQSIIDFLAKEFSVAAPKVVKIEPQELPF
jgi:hypothetical protein